MQISIRNTLGIERADLLVSPVALLTGVNGAGKSSCIAAISSALTGQTLPVGILKRDSKVFVRDGTDSGRVTVKGDDGEVSVSWPAAEATTEGRAPRASEIAAGLSSIVDMDDKSRAKTLAKYLKSDPTKADLAAALRDSDARFVSGGGAATAAEAEAMKPLGLDSGDQRDAAIYRIVEKIWKEIDVNGFDGAHAVATKGGSEIKGAWRQVTGEQYGAAKAPQWQHKDAALAEDLVPEGKDAIAHLTAQVEYFKHFSETTARNAAVHAAMSAGARELVESIPQLVEAEASAKAAKDAASAAYDALKKKAPPPLPMACPHCGAHVAVENDHLIQVSNADVDAVAVEKAAKKLADQKAAAKDAFDKAAETWKAAEKNLTDARAAEKKLGANADGTPAATEDDVVKAKETLDRHERALAAVKQKAEADKLHRQIVINQVLIDVLAPEGVRKTKLSKVLQAFNEGRLLSLANAAEWKAVTIGPDLEIRYGAKLAREPFVSESQVMRTRILLQIAMAQLDGSSMVLIDKADKLDPKGRNGLFNLLAEAGIKAVVATMMARPNLVPDLEGAEIGASYWLKDGIAIPRAEAIQPIKQAAE